MRIGTTKYVWAQVTTPGAVVPASAVTTAAPAATAAVGKESVSQQNARKKAESYLRLSAFSRKSLVDQLQFEGFSPADAEYAVDHVQVDWMEQAAKKAASYLKLSSFSRKSLYDQLVFEGFTPEQATYGVSTTGL